MVTDDGFERIFQVNVLVPYVPYLLHPSASSADCLAPGPEPQGEVHLDDLQFERRTWSGRQAYSDSKLWNVVLAFAVARHWPKTLSSAVDPGRIKRVPTRRCGWRPAMTWPPRWLGGTSNAVIDCVPNPLPMRSTCRSG